MLCNDITFFLIVFTYFEINDFNHFITVIVYKDFVFDESIPFDCFYHPNGIDWTD